MFHVPFLRVIKTQDLIYINVLFAWTHYALYHAKKDPGIIRKPIGKEREETYALDMEDNDSEKQSLDNQSESSGIDSPTHNAFGDDVKSGQRVDEAIQVKTVELHWRGHL